MSPLQGQRFGVHSRAATLLMLVLLGIADHYQSEALGRRVVAMEVKLANTPDDADVRHLLWLKSKLGDRLADLANLA